MHSRGMGGGGIYMDATTNIDSFEVYKTIIGINRLLDSVMFQCVVLHEMGHAFGLGHNDDSQVMSPIINYTKTYCYLSIGEIIARYNIDLYDGQQFELFELFSERK